MDRSLSLEASQVLADAREALAEWIEEGIDAWETAAEPAPERAPVPKAGPSFQLSPDTPALAPPLDEAAAEAWLEQSTLSAEAREKARTPRPSRGARAAQSP